MSRASLGVGYFEQSSPLVPGVLFLTFSNPCHIVSDNFGARKREATKLFVRGILYSPTSSECSSATTLMSIRVRLGANCEADNIPCSRCCSQLLGLHRDAVWKVSFFRDAYLFGRSVHLWEFRYVHGDGNALFGDRNRDVQGRRHNAGNGHAQQRAGHFQQLKAGGELAFDHGFVRRQHEVQR